MKGAKKGIILTTSTFAQPAREAAESLVEKKVALVDGKELTRLMVQHNVGVIETSSFAIKKVDEDFFEK